MNGQEKNRIDITLFIVESIISKPGIKKDIDVLYEENRFKAYDLAKKNKYYNHPILKEGGIEREVYAKRTLGLVLLSEKDRKVHDKLIKILINSWKGLYRFIENKDAVDLEEIFNNFCSSSMTDEEFNGIFTITLFFSNLLDKSIVPRKLVNALLSSYIMRIEYYEKDKSRFHYSNIRNDKVLYNKAISIKERFCETFGDIKYIHEMFSKAKDEDLKYFVEFLSMIFDTENISFTSMFGQKMKIKREDIIELAALYFLINRNQDRVESAKFIIFGLYLKYTIKAYKEIKDFYFKNNKETMYYSLEEKDKQIRALEDTNKFLKYKLEALEAENKNLKSQYKDTIEKENILLHQEIVKLKKEIEELKKDKEELVELRKLIFTSKEEVDLKPKDREVPQINALIAGGHNNWHDKLKEVLPSTFKYIQGDDHGFDVNILNNIDYCFICTKFMNHAFYYKLINKCRALNIKMYYINFTSPEYVREEIIDFLSSSSEEK